MGLIDADKLIEDIHKRSYISKALSEIFETVIDEQPTAYDVDNVVEQLETMKERNPFILNKKDKSIETSTSRQILDYAIEIVKGESEE